MKPPIRPKIEYEKVAVDEWVSGEIEEIQYNMEYKSSWEGKEKVGPAVRLKFKLDGCQWPHYSRWMSFNYGEKANLYKKYVSQLVEGAAPDMEFDLDALKGMKIKTMWANDGDYQKLEMIRPVEKKIPFTAEPKEEEEIPF